MLASLYGKGGIVDSGKQTYKGMLALDGPHFTYY